MQSDQFFVHIENHYSKNLPFVAYRKPRTTVVKGLLQNSDFIYPSQDYKDSGFVFAPFDNSLKTVLIPTEHSESVSCQFDLDEEMSSSELNHDPDTKSKQDHLFLVKKGITAIHQNSFRKVVLSRCEPVTLPKINPVIVFKQLLQNYANAFVYCWFHPKVGLWLGATPETLVQIKGNRFKTMALAGTQPFKSTLDVEWKRKEQEEQQVVTDFIIERLQTSVRDMKISEPRTIKAGQLLHLQTSISGVINTDLKDVVEKLHPTPAVCGFPLEPAKRFIINNETYNREYYTGFLGELNIQEQLNRNTNKRNVENNAYQAINTNSHLFVNLRCMQVKRNTALIYIGGGITKDSSEELEWEETISKAETMKSVLVV